MGIIVILFFGSKIGLSNPKTKELNRMISDIYEIKGMCNFLPQNDSQLVKFLNSKPPCMVEFDKKPYQSTKSLLRQLEDIRLEKLSGTKYKICDGTETHCKEFDVSDSESWSSSKFNF
jgi:hypothetical protein